MLTPSDIKAISDLLARQNLNNPAFWIIVILTALALFFLLWDRSHYLKKSKEIFEDRLKAAKEGCEAEKEKLKAKFEAEKAELKVKHAKEQLHSIEHSRQLSKEALYDKEKIIKGDTEKNFHRLVAAGMQYESIGRHDLAVDCFEDALAIKPEDIGLHLALGVIYGEKIGTKEGKEKAITHCQEVTRIEENNVSGWFNLAVYTNHLKGASDSLPIYLKAEKLIVNQGLRNTEIEGKLNIFIGHDLRAIGKKPEAKERYNTAIEILQQLADKGDMSAAFWLQDVKDNLKELVKDSEGR